jgi:hypothetical protein
LGFMKAIECDRNPAKRRGRGGDPRLSLILLARSDGTLPLLLNPRLPWLFCPEVWCATRVLIHTLLPLALQGTQLGG